MALGSASNLIPARIAAPDKCDEDAKGYTKRGIVFESLLGRESEGRRTPAALMWVSITLAKQSIFFPLLNLVSDAKIANTNWTKKIFFFQKIFLDF